jgi:hypothetical protein
MENTIQFRTKKSVDEDLLSLVSLILLDVNRIVRDIHGITAVLLRYAALAISITNGLIGLIAPSASEMDGRPKK